MAAQSNERTSTRFEGVQQRKSRRKKFNGHEDICFSIDYRDPLSGKRVRKTIGWRSEGVTAQLASRMRQELLVGGRMKAMGECPDDVVTLEEAWKRYREGWLEARGKASLRTDSATFERHVAGSPLASRPLSHISHMDLEDMAHHSFAKGLSAQTVKHILGLIRRVMNKAVVWRLWKGPSPFLQFQMPRVDNQRRRYLKAEELRRLLGMLRERSEKVWLMSLISLQCGLRFGEIARLRKADLDLEWGQIFIRQSKSGKSRYAVMPDSLSAHVEHWCRAMGETDLLFPASTGRVMRNKSPIFDRIVAELGLNDGVVDNRDKFVFHSLRHTYASHLARHGYSQALIAELLGHSSLEMTKRYVHLMPDTRREAALVMAGLLDPDTNPR